MTYVRPEIEVDEDAIAQTSYDLVAARVPGWQADPVSLDTALLESSTRQAAELRSLVVDVSDLIFAAFGESILGFPRITAIPAVGAATFTLLTDPTPGSFTIPAGTQFAGTAIDATQVAFQTTASVTINAGSTTGVAAIAAIIPGLAANGVTGSASMIDAIPQIDSVSITTAAAGGAEAETDQAYLDRLVRHTQLLATHPILPADFAALAMEQPGVYRALAIDGFNPGANTTGNLRTVAVILQGADGQAVSGGIKTAVDAFLQANREVNFVVLVADPVITTVNVTATVVKTPAADSTDVSNNVDAAIRSVLNPARWGGPRLESDPAWSSRPVVYFNDVMGAIYTATGVDRVTALNVGGVTAANGTLALSSSRPDAIPQPGTVGVTVT